MNYKALYFMEEKKYQLNLLSQSTRPYIDHGKQKVTGSIRAMNLERLGNRLVRKRRI